MGALGVLASAMIGACAPTGESSKPGDSDPPSRVEPVAGTKTARVILSSQAMALIGIRMDLVRKPTTGGAQLTVPVSALVYEADGTVWVYTDQSGPANAPGGAVTFVREAVTVVRIDAELAFLQSGPPVGTSVVIVGTAELLGTERGVEGK